MPPPTAVIAVSPPMTRTSSNGTPSVSATSCASAVSTPCPWSGLDVMQVTRAGGLEAQRAAFLRGDLHARGAVERGARRVLLDERGEADAEMAAGAARSLLLFPERA